MHHAPEDWFLSHPVAAEAIATINHLQNHIQALEQQLRAYEQNLQGGLGCAEAKPQSDINLMIQPAPPVAAPSLGGERREAAILDAAIAAISQVRVGGDHPWQWLYRSAGGAALFGFDAPQLMAHPHLWQARIDPEDWATHWQTLPTAIAASAELAGDRLPDQRQWVYRFHHPDGTRRWFATTANAQYEAATATWLITLVELDITPQQQAAQGWQRREEKLRLAIELNQFGIWDWHIPTGKVTWNETNYRLLGVEPGSCEPSYEAWLRCIHPDDIPAAEAAVQAALQTGECFTFEHRVLQPAGGDRWLMGKGRILTDEAGNPLRMMGIVTDITQRKQAELALADFNQNLNQLVIARSNALAASQAIVRQNKRRLRHLAANMPGVIFQFKVSAEGIRSFPYLSNAAATLYGLTVATLQKNPTAVFEACHPSDRPSLEQSLQTALAALSSWQWEGRFRKPSGTLVWVQWIAKPTRLANGDTLWDGLALDVSDRKHAEAAISQSEATFRKLFEAAPMPIGIIRTDTLQIVKVNPAYVAMMGYSSEELQHMTLADYSDPEDLTADLTQVQALAAGELSSFCIEKRYIHKTGDIIWGKLTATLVHGWGIAAPCCMGMIEDITASKKLQAQRAAAELALQQQVQREQVLRRITQHIHQSLDAAEVLQAAVHEVRSLLQAERVAIYRFHPDWSGSFITESVNPGWTPLVGFDERQKVWRDTYLQETQGGRYRQREWFAVQDIYTVGHRTCHIALLEQFQARAYVIAPIFKGDELWGLLAAYQNSAPRQWQDWEIELLVQIADQIAIAIQQADLYQQVQTQLTEQIQAQDQLTCSLREKDILLKELHHRVKNNLQIVSSLLRMQARQTAHPHTAILFQEAQNRVQSMASIHEQFYQSPDLAKIDFNHYIHTLANHLFQSYGISQSQVQLLIDVQEVSLSLDLAVPCGLMINELISNALKYAFPDQRPGCLTIRLQPTPPDAPSTPAQAGLPTSYCCLVVQDDGIGLPASLDWSTAPSLGLRIVRNLAEQIKGHCQIRSDRGFTFQLTFPLAPSS